MFSINNLNELQKEKSNFVICVFDVKEIWHLFTWNQIGFFKSFFSMEFEKIAFSVTFEILFNLGINIWTEISNISTVGGFATGEYWTVMK